MQRLACLFMVICAACGGGTATGTASLTGVEIKASAVETFVAADATGTEYMGWNILLYEQEAGGDCLEGTILAKVSIFTNQTESSGKPNAILQTGGISIVVDSPPTVTGAAVANMGAEGVGAIAGIVNIDDFHLTADGETADNIKGTISAGGFDSADNGVALNGEFDAPICKEN